jgi:HK97 family phage major capsid protein
MAIIDRSASSALIPEEAYKQIMQEVSQGSTVLPLMTKLAGMSRSQLRIPVLTALPSAYFVTGDTGFKQTSATAWDNVYITAEEIAVIVPIPEAVIADADYDIWAEVNPKIGEAFGRTIDLAILFGDNKPASWPLGIVPNAIAKGNSVEYGELGDMFDDIMGVDGVLAKVEEDGFMVSAHIAALSMKAKLRGLRDENEQPIFVSTLQEKVSYALDGQPLMFPTNGGFDNTEALLVSGDFKQAVYSVRQDMTYKILTEATIQDANGDVMYNLAQQDMIALRVVMRLGWALPQPTRALAIADPYPFAVLTPAEAPVSGQ